jgi:hypothetical protein
MERRALVIQVRVNPDELAELQKAAGDYPVATWLRATALAAARASTEKGEDR